MGPTWEKKKKKKTQTKSLLSFIQGDKQTAEMKVLKFFFSISFISQILEFLTVRIRRVKHGKCSTRRGLRVSIRNTRFHR